MDEIRKSIGIIEHYSSLPHKFYHGSMEYLKVGTILTPRDNYEDNWGHTDFYRVLEMYRPSTMLSHKNSVFMVGSEDDIDLTGGGTNWVFVVNPLGIVEKHDMNWSSEISMLMSEGYDAESEEVMRAALNYWNGTPHVNESVWEYVTPKCEIIDVYEY